MQHELYMTVQRECVAKVLRIKRTVCAPLGLPGDL